MHTVTRRYPQPYYIFLDQDGPLADFESGMRQVGLPAQEAKLLPGFYSQLPLTPGAAQAVAELCAWKHVHVFVATKIPDRNPLAASEKIHWLHAHLPQLEERIIITPNKAVLGGPKRYLVDDRHHKADVAFFDGHFVHFGSQNYPDWAAVLERLRREIGPATPAAQALVALGG